jgi:hypothetical protein
MIMWPWKNLFDLLFIVYILSIYYTNDNRIILFELVL